MLKHLQAVPPDPILGLISAYAEDNNPKKIDLGIGVYKDESGNTPILNCVKKAEQTLHKTQSTKTYLGPAGVVGFNSAITELLFGSDSQAVQQGRVVTVHTPGGTGALRVAGDVIQAANPGAGVWASDPTWGNHLALFPAAGLNMHSYPYFDVQNSSLRFEDMMTALQQRGPGDVVLFHACCHNPSGVTPNPEQWEAITDLAAKRGFFPLIDIAYMGFERGIEQDTLAVRLFTKKCKELIVASSCSKNFAMYRERVGAISVVSESAEKSRVITSVINNVTRKNYSMAPAHGPAVIDIILHSDELRQQWVEEVAAMRQRINDLRKILSEKIAVKGIQQDFSFIQRQTGMFSFMGISPEQVQQLRDQFAIYTVSSSRVNIASFNQANMDYFTDALASILNN